MPRRHLQPPAAATANLALAPASGPTSKRPRLLPGPTGAPRLTAVSPAAAAGPATPLGPTDPAETPNPNPDSELFLLRRQQIFLLFSPLFSPQIFLL